MAHNEGLAIESAFYASDEGGIMYDVTPLKERRLRRRLLCARSRANVSVPHPLASEIQLYQEERMRKLAQQGGLRAPFSFTVEPRKRRGHSAGLHL
jgi:hypothetical protein